MIVFLLSLQENETSKLNQIFLSTSLIYIEYKYYFRSPSPSSQPDTWSEPSVFGDRAKFYPYLPGSPALLRNSTIKCIFLTQIWFGECNYAKVKNSC